MGALTADQFRLAYSYALGSAPPATLRAETLQAQLLYWPQLSAVALGALLIAAAYGVWQSAQRREHPLGFGLTVVLAVALMVGGWLLLSEVPRTLALGGRETREAMAALERTALYSIGTVPNWSWDFAFDILRHQLLPGLALILGSVGGWVLSMRGMGITIQGEDYVNFAEHKGLTGGRIFRDYYLRNTLLPQVTGLALALGTVVTSAIIVEGLFGLPGLGTVLNNAIRANDFPVIYGIVLFITIAIAVLMAILEFVYPLLDPRVRNQ